MICTTDKCKQGKHQCPTPSKCGKVTNAYDETLLIGFWAFVTLKYIFIICLFAGFLTG